MRRNIVFAAALALIAAAPVAAQIGNMSDVTGVVTTGSTVANIGAPAVDAQGMIITPGLLTFMDAAGFSVASSMSRGTLTSPVGASISPAAQSLVLAVGIGVDPPQLLAQALGNSPEAAMLANAMAGLLFSATPEQLGAARDAFNALVMAADQAYLAAPPGEFLAVHAVLNSLIGAAARTASI